MTNIKTRFKTLQNVISKQPRYVIIIAAVVFLVVATGFEQLRAVVYLNHVDKYNNSEQTRAAIEIVDSMQQQGSSSELCNLDAAGSISVKSNAYPVKDIGVVGPISRLRDQLSKILPSPTYNSYFRFLPKVSQARKRSNQMVTASNNLVDLVKLDDRTEYCRGLQDVLSAVYFLNSLKTPQGVSALHVGQIEDFQVSLSKAQRALLELESPTLFRNDHSAINDALNSAALSLRSDTNAYRQFSRDIELSTSAVAVAVESIRQKSEDLQSKPSDLLLHIQQFRAEH